MEKVLVFRPKLRLAFVKTFVLIGLLTIIFDAAIPAYEGRKIVVTDVLQLAAVLGCFGGVAACFIFAPANIILSSEYLEITRIFRGRKTYHWRNMEAWDTQGGGTFIFRFAGGYPIQIGTAGFSAEDLKKLAGFLTENYPSLRATITVGGWPLPGMKR